MNTLSSLLLSIMRRLLCLSAVILFLSAPAMAEQIMLNKYVEVKEDFITLGDIFSPLDHGSDHVVSRAPALGEVLELDMQALERIAKSFKLDWQPRSRFERVTVRRATSEVTLEVVQQALRDELLRREGIQPRDGITWTVELKRSPTSFHVPLQTEADIRFVDLRFDTKNSRFQADVELYKSADIMRLRGEFYASIAVPMPLHSISKDEIITERDLHFVHLRKDKVPPNVQTDISKVIGKSPKRLLRADAPIAMQYLQEPLLVKRQRLVSVIYSVKNLVLTTKGMALSDGSLGQVVRVKNLKSNRIIDSVVTGSDEVSVSFVGENVLSS